MPIYEYKCADCGAQVERMQKISDELLTICETCGGKLEKQWSLSGFQFKGAGWYVTDYSNKGKESGAEKSAKGKSGKTEEKSDKTEKNSAESTAAPQSASNQSNDAAAATSSKKDTSSKSD